MSRLDCGEANKSVPCRCDRYTGCGHLSSWHRVFERWQTRCLVPGCECSVMDACNCVEGLEDASAPSDSMILAGLGIAL